MSMSYRFRFDSVISIYEELISVTARTLASSERRFGDLCSIGRIKADFIACCAKRFLMFANFINFLLTKPGPAGEMNNRGSFGMWSE